MKYEYHIEPIPAQTMDSLIERFNALGVEGWRVSFNFPTKNHVLFEREVVQPFPQEGAVPHD